MRPKKKDEYDEIYDNSVNLESDDEYEDNAEASRDWLGYDIPDCPRCGKRMKVRFGDNNFKCFSCGYSVDEEDLEDELDANDNFEDTYQDGLHNPRCEVCGTPMKYSSARQKFKCPCCASTIDELDWELANEHDDYDEYYDSVEMSEDDKPECCINCDGPYPYCANGCELLKNS